MSQSAIPTAEEASSADSTKPSFDFDAVAFAPAIVWVVCVALAILCNSGSLFGREWIWTDEPLIHRNPLIGMLNGLQLVWSGMFNPDRYLLPQFSPLSQTMFFFERAVFGDNPTGFRAVSAILHGSCAAVLYLLLRGLRVRGAIVVTLLFVVHPVLVDSVSFLTERRNPLGGLLGLSALYILFRGAGAIPAPPGKFKLLPDDPSRLYFMGGALFVLSLFAQPAVAALGPVALLILWARRIRVAPGFATMAVGVAVLGAVLMSVSSRVERAHSPYAARQWERAPTAAGEMAVRTQIAGRAVFFYLQKSLLPYPLSMDYGRWITPNDLQDFREFAPDASKSRFEKRIADVGTGRVVAWLFPIAIFAILATLFALANRIGRLPFALGASFVLLLLPFLGFIDLGWMQYSFVSHRSLYLAVIPVLLGLVLAFGPVLGDPNQRVSLIASVVIVLIVMIRLGAGVSFRYQYNLSFWRDSDLAANSRRSALNFLTRTPWYSRLQAAHWLLNYEGRLALGFKPFQDAFDPHGELGKAYDASDSNAYVNLVKRVPDWRLFDARLIFSRMSGSTRARDLNAQASSPADGDALEKFYFFNNDVLENLRPGNQEALLSLARVLHAWRQDQEAASRLSFVIANFPNDSAAYRLVGDIQRRAADRAPTDPGPRLAALDSYERAALTNPLDAEARLLVAETAWDIAQRLPTEDVEGVQKRMGQAAEAFDAADEIRPYDVAQLLRESKTLIAMRLLPAAASRLKMANTIEPKNAEVLLAIGDATVAGGQLSGAEAAYRQSLSLDETLVQAYLNYSAMLASQERYDEAEEWLDRGLKKLPENEPLLDAVKKLRDLREKSSTKPAAAQSQ